MLNPEIANRGVGVREGVSVIGERVGKVARVEIHSHSLLFAPVDPTLKLRGRIFVAVDFFASQIRVAGMEIEAVFTRNEREGLVEIGAELCDRTGFAGVVAGGLNSTTRETSVGFFKPSDIVTLPTMEGDRNGFQVFEGLLGIDSEIGVLFAGGCVCGHKNISRSFRCGC